MENIANTPVLEVILADAGTARYPYAENTSLSFSERGALLHIDFSEKIKNVQRQVQAGAKKLSASGYRKVKLVDYGSHQWTRELAYAFFIGFRTVKYGTDIVYPENLTVDTAFSVERNIISWLRDTIDMPASELTPLSYMNRLTELNRLCGNRLSIKVISGAELAAEKMVGLQTVGAGSANAPCMYELEYVPVVASSQVTVALVGKGITFDTGGYSLKPSDLMRSMHTDMGGSATVAAAAALLAAKDAGCRVKAYLCCAENMISGSAMRVGDIIRYPNGVSVVVDNTDAEGRLVLADGLIRAADADYIIDAATLTGAAKVALGRDYNAVLSLSSELTHAFLNAADNQGEYAWPLPFAGFHLGLVSSPLADITNSAGGDGIAGATSAAAFLSYFVPKEKHNSWIHVDLAASYRKTANDIYNVGAMGHGARTIAAMVEYLAARQF